MKGRVDGGEHEDENSSENQCSCGSLLWLAWISVSPIGSQLFLKAVNNGMFEWFGSGWRQDSSRCDEVRNCLIAEIDHVLQACGRGRVSVIVHELCIHSIPSSCLCSLVPSLSVFCVPSQFVLLVQRASVFSMCQRCSDFFGSSVGSEESHRDRKVLSQHAPPVLQC